VKLPTSVEIVEVGPRDGLQNEAVLVPAEQKILLLSKLASAGIRRFEATSFVSPKWIPQLADAEEVINGTRGNPQIVRGGLVANERGYNRALAAGVDEIALVMSATEGHSRANLNRSVKEQLETFRTITERAKSDGLYARVNISTVFGCPFDGVPSLDRISELVAAIARLGIIEITLSDTIGVANPRQVLDVFSSLRAQHKKIRFGAHFHDTRGLALANAVAALDAGIELFDSSVGGLGGCPYAPGASGNVATEDLVYMFEAMGITTGISLPALLGASQFVEGLVQHTLSARTKGDLL
jgi:hydroxymethylglutaryl-CoA lyase